MSPSTAAEPVDDLPQTPHEGFTTLLALAFAFVAVHFFVPDFIKAAPESINIDADAFKPDLLSMDGQTVTITESVFDEDRSDRERNIDLQALQSLGYTGDIKAQMQLAEHFAMVGDESRAFQWGFRAAMQGNGLSMLETGQRYYYGRGTRKSLMRAIQWYRLAANYGEAAGMDLASAASLRLSDRELKQVESQFKSLQIQVKRKMEQDQHEGPGGPGAAVARERIERLPR